MESLGTLEQYIAFFIACDSSFNDYVMDSVQEFLITPNIYLCAVETCKHAHKQHCGNHIHFLISTSNKRYKAFIQHLKKTIPLRGQAKDGLSRTYGKVQEQIRDLMLMGAYTLKSQQQYKTNIPQKIIDEMIEISYSKGTDDRKVVSEIMEFISTNLKEVEERNESLKYRDAPLILCDQHVKQAILHYYLNRKDSLKLPTRCRVHYLATRWALYHSSWPMEQICYYFYR